MAAARVLAVDDEPAVLGLVEFGLRRAGFEVLRASRAREALEIVGNGEQIDVLLTDVVMPDMSGIALAEEVRRRCPDTGILLMTGYAGSVELPPGTAVLDKPFVIDQLVAAVERVLADASAARRELRRAVRASEDVRAQSGELRADVRRLFRICAENVQRLKDEAERRKKR